MMSFPFHIRQVVAYIPHIRVHAIAFIVPIGKAKNALGTTTTTTSMTPTTVITTAAAAAT